MIFHVGQPLVFLGMGLGFVVAVLVHNLAQALAARAIHDPAGRMRRRGLIEPRHEFEPFGIIAVLIGGIGWGQQVPFTEPRGRGRRRGEYIAALLAGPIADALLGVAFLAAFAVLTARDRIDVPTGQRVIVDANAGYQLLGLIGVMCIAIGILYLIPLPPLDGARIMWVLAPKSAGWQRARYNLEEQNWGLGALVILSLPLFSGTGLVVRLVYAVAVPLIDAVTTALGGR